MTNDESAFVNSYSRFLDDSGEHLTYAALSTYRNFSEELSQKEKQFFQKHLDLCADCAARLKEVSEVEGGIVTTKSKIIDGISPSIFRYAAAATVVIAAGVGSYFTFQQVQQKNAVTHTIVSEQQSTPINFDTEKFAPNPVLENFIERTVRSAQRVWFLAPHIGDTITIPYTVTWEGPKDQYTLHVVNNKNIVIWEGVVSSNKIIVSKKLETGLYYLKLEVNQRLTDVGKVVIVR